MDVSGPRRQEAVKDVCAKYKASKSSISVDQIKKFQEEVFIILKNFVTAHDDLCIKHVIDTVQELINEHTLESPSPICVAKWALLRVCMAQLLRMWYNGHRIDGHCYNAIVQAFDPIFSIKAKVVNETIAVAIGQILLDKAFVNEIIIVFNKVVKADTKGTDKQIPNQNSSQLVTLADIPLLIDLIMNAYYILYASNKEIQDDETLSLLIKALIEYFISPRLSEMVLQMNQQRNQLSDDEKLVLVTTARFFFDYNGQIHKPLINQVHQNVVTILTLRIANYSHTGAIAEAVFHLSEILVHTIKHLPSLYSDNYGNCCKLIDQLCETITQLNGGMGQYTVRIRTSVKTLLRLLYYFTNHKEFLKHIQARGMRPLLLKLTGCDENATKNYANQILSVISINKELIEERQDMKSVVVASLKVSVEDEEDAKCLEKSLQGIQVLINEEDKHEVILVYETRDNEAVDQNLPNTEEQGIKDELVKEDGITPLVLVATEPKFDAMNVQAPAIQILAKLAFHRDAINALKKYPELIAKLEDLCNDEEETALDVDVDEGISILFWKLTREKKPKREQSTRPNNIKHDIMISYSHKDKTLCHKIHSGLKKKQYVTWIDIECLRNRKREGMARAIESSSIVLVFISESYIKSPVCRSEVEYASEKGRNIIPIYVQKGFRVDQGWLCFLINDCIYIDFCKDPFNTAFTKLVESINDYLNPYGVDTTSGSRSNNIEQESWLQERKEFQDKIASLEQQYAQNIDEVTTLLENKIKEISTLKALVTSKDSQLEKESVKLQEHLDYIDRKKDEMQQRHMQRETDLLNEIKVKEQQLAEKTRQLNAMRTYPANIQTWLTIDVYTFLESKNFNCLLSYFNSDGRMVYKFYRDSVEKREETFKKLQTAVARNQNELTEEQYDHFIREIEEYIPLAERLPTSSNKKKADVTYSKSCTLL